MAFDNAKTKRMAALTIRKWNMANGCVFVAIVSVQYSKEMQ